jgi:hypothetical protein
LKGLSLVLANSRFDPFELLFFKRAGLNIEDYKIPLDKAAHRLLPDGIHTGPAAESWNGVWKQFFDANPGAGKQAILDQLAKMRKAFGI